MDAMREDMAEVKVTEYTEVGNKRRSMENQLWQPLTGEAKGKKV